MEILCYEKYVWYLPAENSSVESILGLQGESKSPKHVPHYTTVAVPSLNPQVFEESIKCFPEKGCHKNVQDT